MGVEAARASIKGAGDGCYGAVRQLPLDQLGEARFKLLLHPPPLVADAPGLQATTMPKRARPREALAGSQRPVPLGLGRAVTQAGLAGVPHARYGEDVKAVSPSSPAIPPAAEIVEWCRPAWRPTSAPALPRSATGSPRPHRQGPQDRPARNRLPGGVTGCGAGRLTPRGAAGAR